MESKRDKGIKMTPLFIEVSFVKVEKIQGYIKNSSSLLQDVPVKNTLSLYLTFYIFSFTLVL